MPPRQTKEIRKAHRFGGNWTTAKLDVIAQYLHGYTTALKDKPNEERPFRKAYIDAFAGTGYREERREEEQQTQQGLPFPDLAKRETQELIEGSAKLALQTQPRFDKYIFIERNPSRCQQLENLKEEFPALAADIDIRCGDANLQIRQICKGDWRSHRAVLFLDPYGMQVEWKTIQAIAATRAIDLWLLFPLGMGVNRLLTKSGDIPAAWRRRLDDLLGTAAWYDEFYRVERTPALFGGDRDHVVKASMATIGRYFVERLKKIFPGVAENPGVLRNSTNNPLYLLCFAASNEGGAKVALRIAGHLLKDLR
jgi:three-Cys-motif partner protein